MSDFTILRAADRLSSPWKNGGGVTQEVAVYPPGAGFEDFLWRVSIATITREGPFSTLPGVRRLFRALEGRLRITIDGQSHDIGPADPTIAFDGAAAVSAMPLDGLARDFNLMLRKRFSGSLRRASGRSDISGDFVLVLALRQSKISLNESPLILSTYDALIIERPLSVVIHSTQSVLIASIMAS